MGDWTVSQENDPKQCEEALIHHRAVENHGKYEGSLTECYNHYPFKDWRSEMMLAELFLIKKCIDDHDFISV